MLIPNITYGSVSTEDDSPKWGIYEMSTHDIYVKMKDDEDFNKLHHEFLNLMVNWSDDQNKTLRTFWLSYIDMTELLLNTIYAVRSGSWHLLLEYIREILPYTFAYDHVHYARYLTAMLGDMLRLETASPEIYE